MPRNARIVAPGLPYHVTQRGTNGRPVFAKIADRKLYLRLIRENLHEAAARILAFTLMTNHVHFIVIPEREDSLAILFGRANGRYAQANNIARGRSGHLWQARFYSCVMSDSHLAVGLRYVEENACRAGMVAEPGDYRWSSAAAHLKGTPDRSGILDLKFRERAGREQTWAEMYAADGYEEPMRELRQCTYAGRPFGDEAFLTAMEQRFGRKWRRKAADEKGKVANFGKSSERVSQGANFRS